VGLVTDSPPFVIDFRNGIVSLLYKRSTIPYTIIQYCFFSYCRIKYSIKTSFFHFALFISSFGGSSSTYLGLEEFHSLKVFEMLLQESLQDPVKFSEHSDIT